MNAPLAASPLEPAGTVRGARWRARAAVATVVMLALLAGWLLWDNRRLEVTTYQVEVTGLAGSTEGLRIVQLSDLHAADFGDFTQRLVDQVRAAEPDLMAVTGDLVDLHTRDLAPVLELMARLDRIAPVHLVLGNHEAESPVADELLEGLATVGVEVLRDQARSVTVRGTEITLAGLDDPHVAHLAGGEPRDPGAVLEGLELPVGPPVVLLAHRPELLDRYAAAPVDVVLSGHAHGGQVRLPWWGGLYAPNQGWLPDRTEGLHTVAGTTMVISRGLGNSQLGVRAGNPRELVVVDLIAPGAS